MGDDYGLQFSPTVSMSRQSGAGAGDPNQGVQEAIRTLSLRVPRISGAQGFSPLVNAPGGQGVATPGGMSLDQLLLQIFGGKRPQGPGMGQSQGPSMGQSFAPSFTPGLLDPNRQGGGPPENPFDLQTSSSEPAPQPFPTMPAEAPTTRSSRMYEKYLTEGSGF